MVEPSASTLACMSSCFAPASQAELSDGALASSGASTGPSGSLLPYVLGGTALAGVGGYFMLVNWGRQDNQQLARCSPNCSPDSVSHIRRLYLAADISLGVSIAAALGAGAWLLFSSSHSSTERTPPAAAYALSVQPERAGALATFEGSF
jgi:hypothetical protein